MWTAEQSRKKPATAGNHTVDQGTVTVSGELTGVYLDGDRRWMPVYGPGGYCWRPDSGDEVLVMKTGQWGESTCVAGKKQVERGLKPGEVAVHSTSGAGLVLSSDRRVEVTGDLYINGSSLRQIIEGVVWGALGGT